MKKTLIRLSIVSIVLFVTIKKCVSLIPMGGVIGNIEKYEFNLHADSLKVILNNLYTQYPELIKTDTTKYGNNDGKSFYFVVKDKQDTTVFECHVISYSEDPQIKTVDLSLTTAATWGERMDLAPNMGFWKKRGFERTFEDKILSKVKEEVKKRKGEKQF